jgi:hypothetical protein
MKNFIYFLIVLCTINACKDDCPVEPDPCSEYPEEMEIVLEKLRIANGNIYQGSYSGPEYPKSFTEINSHKDGSLILDGNSLMGFEGGDANWARIRDRFIKVFGSKSLNEIGTVTFQIKYFSYVNRINILKLMSNGQL